MSSTTALQMVNRLLRKYRMDDVGDFSSPEALVALDCLNDAKDEVLDSRHWKFDERESAINTQAIRQGVDTNIIFSNGASAMLGTTSLNNPFHGDFTVRCVPIDSPDRSNTAHRVSFGSTGVGIIGFTLSEPYGGVTGSYDATLFSAEYQWPYHTSGDSKVKRLLSMRHQETPLRIVEVDRNFRFDSVVTRLHEQIGSDPEVVYYGKPVNNTGDLFGFVSTIREGFMIWPVPTASVRLDYTYLYAHPQIALETDTLENVPDRVINAMIELAYGFSLNTKFGNDPTLADRVMKSALVRIERLHASDRRMPQRAKPLRSLDEIGYISSGRSIPSDLIVGY